VDADAGGLYVAKSFGRGGTGGTYPSSGFSPARLTRLAALSRRLPTSAEWILDASLPPLLRLVLLNDDRAEMAEVALVLAEKVVESLELVVGVLANVVEEAEPLLAVKLERPLAGPSLLLGRRPDRPGVAITGES